MSNLNLFALAASGVNVTEAPTHLKDDEVTLAQNIEVVSSAGEGAIDKRPGMVRLNATALASSLTMAEDLRISMLADYTPYLYAGMYTGSTHNWRYSADGVTWVDADTPAKPFSNNANIGFFKNFPKAVTVDRALYYVDGSTPIGVHRFDGTTDTTITSIPPAVSGTLLSTPAAGTTTVEGYTPGATTYTYKLVAKLGTSTSAASAAFSATTGNATLNTTTDYVGLTLGTPVSGATSYDVYRTVGGASQGKIGSVPIVAGAFTQGNGSGLSGAALGAPLVSPSAPTGLVFGMNGALGATTYTYVFVPKSGTSHGTASVNATITTGNATLNAGNYLVVTNNGSSPPAGATSLDVYRTAGGTTQGKIGNIPITAGAYTVGNGSNAPPGTYIFSDTGLVGDGVAVPAASGFSASPTFDFSDGGLAGDAAVAPSSPSGSTPGDALGVLDTITDGTYIYFAILDYAPGSPTFYGRILSLDPRSAQWSQVIGNFPLSKGNGSPGALVFHTGALSYGTYIGTTSGVTSYMSSTGYPLPAGGVQETATTAASRVPCCFAVFQGALYTGYVSLVAGTAAIVGKRAASATYSTSLTASATAAFNAYTTLGVFNGKLYAGWTSGGGATAAIIKSTPDGVTWTTEITLDAAEVPCQMVTFQGSLYVALGRTGVGYNTKSRILKCTTGGTWSSVDDPSDDYAGCIGVIYR